MNKLDLVRMAFQNLRRRKLRTFLTVLGVLIGTVSIVVMMSLGVALQESQKENIQRMGGLTVLDVYAEQYWSPDMGTPMPTKGLLDDNLVKKLQETPHITAVLPVLRVEEAPISVGNYRFAGELLGIDPSYMETFGFEAESGRLLSPGDKDVIFFGPTDGTFYDAKSMSFGVEETEPPAPDVFQEKVTITLGGYEDKSPFGSGNTSKKFRYKTVGVMPYTSHEHRHRAYITLDQAQKLQAETFKMRASLQPADGQLPVRKTAMPKKTVYSEVKVKVDHLDSVEPVIKVIEELGYQAHGMGQWVKEMQQQTAMIQAVLGGIGSISLLVAAIGIANTMIMSIYERTREIGVMKVIGASISHIRSLFLVEASMIGLLGGIVGLTLSYLLSYVLNTLAASGLPDGGMGGPAQQISIIPWWLALSAILFSAVVGLVSGYYPALKATKLSAIEAIRTE